MTASNQAEQQIDLTKTQVVNEGKAIPKKLSAFIAIFLKRHPLSMLAIAFFIVFEASINPVKAYLLKVIIDHVLAAGDHLDSLLQAVLVPALCYASIPMAINLGYTTYRIASLQFYPKLKSDIAGTMHHYLSQHSYRYFGEHFSGSLSKKIFDLCTGAEAVLQILTHKILPQALAALASSLILYTVHPLFCAMLLGWSVCYVLFAYSMSKRSEQLSYALSAAGNNMSGKLVDSIINVMSTKLFANNQHEERVVFSSIDNLMAKDRALQWYILKAYFKQGLWIFVLVSAMLFGLIYGRLHNFVTIGDFALILTLSFTIAESIFNMGEEILRLAKEAGNCRQALNIIVEPHEVEDLPSAKDLQVTQGKIVFEEVQFRYQGSDPLFENKTVTILPGQKVGLVGHSGSGKSTFVNLILRLFDVSSGRITIDGEDIKAVTQASLRKNIGMIPQDPSLFHRTLFENIQYGRVDANRNDVIEATKKAHAHEFIAQLAQGYDSLVGERGVKLSGGQRQRIAIARAFLKNAPILILDEATSQLDSVTEQYIQESLWELMQNKTTIVIAHRLSTLLHMDRILVFEKGKIVEDGTHQELLTKNGHYATLWKAQVGGFLLDEDEIIN
ncbi:MAG: ABC transporter ATP-binding protein [Candidatus Berkiella sp.]